MSRATRFGLGRLFGGIALALILPACGAPTAPQTDQLQAAIDLLKGIDPALGGALQNFKIADKIKVNTVLPDARAYCSWDEKPTKAGDVIVLDKSLFSTEANFKCSVEFLTMSCVLLHELEHADELVVQGATRELRKRERARNELRAYISQKRCAEAWRDAVDQLLAGLPVPAPFAFLAGCDALQLLLLRAVANSEIILAEEYIAFLQGIVTNPTLTAEQINAMPLAKRVGLDKVRSVAVESLIISSNSTRVSILNFNTLAYQFFETSVPALTTIFSLAGAEAFLITGTDSYATPTHGQVVLVLDTNRDNSYDTAHPLTDSAGLRLPQSIAVRNNELFVYDAALRRLFPLLDTDHDGNVDTIGGTIVLEVPPHAEEDAGFPLDPITQVHFIDGEFVGLHGNNSGEGDVESPIAHWREANGSLIFDGYRKWPDWGVTSPFPRHPLIPNTTEVKFRGAIGSTIDVVEIAPGGMEATIGSGLVGSEANGAATVSPIKGVASGFKYILRDQTKGFSSLPIPISRKQPYVLDLSPASLEGLSGGTEITLTGDFLGLVSSVKVGGTAVSVTSQRKQRITFTAPSTSFDGGKDIVLFWGTEQLLVATLYYHVPSAPRLVVTRPTLEERLFASTGAATSLSIEVLLAMDMVGTPLGGQQIEVRNFTGAVIGSGHTNEHGIASFSVPLNPHDSRIKFTVRATLSDSTAPIEQEITIR